MKSKRITGHIQPCFSCAKACNMYLCPWANPNNPELPDGCKAEPVMIPAARGANTRDRVLESYAILSCPDWVEG